MTECAYKDRGGAGGVACSGPVAITIHDKRGCLDVCYAHAQWRLTTSIAFGHAESCSSFTIDRLSKALDEALDGWDESRSAYDEHARTRINVLRKIKR